MTEGGAQQAAIAEKCPVGLRSVERILAEWQAGCRSEQFVFIDESGFTISMTRTRVRSPREERVRDHVIRRANAAG
ncbi:MAG: hypothetical protein ACOYOB_20535 [Myxococcota bacterium]